MRSLRVACYSLCVALSFALSGCNGRGSIPQSATMQASLHKATSSGASYIYATDQGVTYVLTYPDGQYVAQINDWGWMCSDANTGDVYISNGGAILDYPPGGTTRVALFTFPTGLFSAGCSVSPTNGNVAVVATQSIAFHHVQHTWAYVFATGLRKLARKLVPHITTQSEFCGYDAQGNLFVDGQNLKTRAFELAELKKNARGFIEISVGPSVDLAAYGPVQWDGKYITVEDPNRPTIYRIAVSGSTGTVVGTTVLRHPSGTRGEKNAPTWIQGNTVLAPTNLGKRWDNSIGLWNYPRGRQPYKVLNRFVTHGHGYVLHVVVSVAPSH